MERKSINELIENELKKRVSFLQVITKESYVVADIVDNILMEKFGIEEIIHYDILQGFDVPIKETVQQHFAKTIDKWLYEKTLNNTAMVINGSDKIFEDEMSVLAIRKMLGENSKKICSRPTIVVVISDSECLPLQLRDLGTIIRTPLMNIDECEAVVKTVLKEAELSKKVARELLGLTQNQVEICLREICLFNKETGWEEKFINKIKEKKAELLNQSGMLSIEESCNDDELGGFGNLKNWLKEISVVPDDEDEIFPKGMLLVGVTGCGKSLAVRASAHILNYPLLRIDFGLLMNKYVGESEKNLSSALQVVESIAPCVLWMDEFEKAFVSSDENSGVSQRMLGQFLTWLQERKQKVFTVATVNNVSKLPPELLRRGRFDKIYYVDLPEDDERKAIIEIHAKKLGIELNETQIALISSDMSGRDYSGADIEYLLKEAKRRQYSRTGKAIDELIQECLSDTTPVGSIMSVEIKEMREEFTSRGFDNVNSMPEYESSIVLNTTKQKRTIWGK